MSVLEDIAEARGYIAQKAPKLTTLDALPQRKPAVAKIIELWPEANRELFEERAAIREFDGGMNRETTERLALKDVERKRRDRKA